MTDHPDVTIVIVSWNTKAALLDCLRSVVKRSGPEATEIIVVDNRSCDGSADAVADLFPEVVLIRNRRNVGFAAACNQALAGADGRFVLLLNSDAVLGPTTLSTVLSFAEANVRSAAVGCRVLNPDGSIQPSCRSLPGIREFLYSALFLARFFPGSREFGRDMATWWGYDEVREVEALKGCFLLLRRGALAEVGRFDEDFFVYGEEVDWCHRARMAGWNVTFTPAGTVVHEGGASAAEASRSMIRQLWGSKLLLVRKHRSRTEYLVCCGLVELFFALRVLPCMVASLTRDQSRRRRNWDLALAYGGGLGALACGGARGLCVSPPSHG